MSNQRVYELTMLIQPQLDEESRKQLIDQVAGMLTHGEGEEAKPSINHWGMRSLAYPINDFTEAYYVYYEALLDGTKIRGIEREFLYNDNIIRHLFVRKAEQ